MLTHSLCRPPACLTLVSQALPLYSLPLVLPFIIGKGLADSNINVSLASLDAGREIMKQYGSVAVADLQPILEVRAPGCRCRLSAI